MTLSKGKYPEGTTLTEDGRAVTLAERAHGVRY